MEKFEGLKVPFVIVRVGDQQKRQRAACTGAWHGCDEDCKKCLFNYQNPKTLPAFIRWEESQKNEGAI